jgi:hypothetical protein
MAAAIGPAEGAHQHAACTRMVATVKVQLQVGKAPGQLD